MAGAPRHPGLGIYGLFGYHFLLFTAFRHAPPVEANLVNYLWPLGIVVMAPLFLPGVRLGLVHVLAALLGFGGAALVILGGRSLKGGFAWGYLPALGAAFVWASYSLMTKRVRPFPTAAIGLFGLVSGLLSLACHALMESAVTLSARDWGLITLMGLGPLGAAFFLWDAALKRGDARHIGLLSFLTPLLSTLLLLAVRGERPSATVGIAAAMIVGAPRARACGVGAQHLLLDRQNLRRVHGKAAQAQAQQQPGQGDIARHLAAHAHALALARHSAMVSATRRSTAGCSGSYRWATDSSARSMASVYWIRSLVPMDRKSKYLRNSAASAPPPVSRSSHPA
jgi:uncharacterized membrane protein